MVVEKRHAGRKKYNLDRKLGRMWSKLLSIIPLSVAAILPRSPIKNNEDFRSITDYLGTRILIIVFVALGIWPWRRDHSFTESIDQ